VGAQAIILRDPARAASTVAEFAALGIESRCVQLIETVWPAQLAELDRCLDRLAAGGYDWAVFTSVSTVAACARRLAGRRMAAGTRIAAVGRRTAEAVREQLGRTVDFLPREQSAAGMVREWSLPAGSRVLYAHGDLASGTLGEGLAGWGVRLDEVIAYRTVDAGSGGERVQPRQEPAGVAQLDPAALPGQLEHTDLLVFAAPSIVRRFIALAGTRLPERVRTIAIGQPTARTIQQAGLRLDATAADPTPAGLARCARELLQTRSLKA